VIDVGPVLVITVAESLVGIATDVVGVVVMTATPPVPEAGPGAVVPELYWKDVSVPPVKPALIASDNVFAYGAESLLEYVAIVVVPDPDTVTVGIA
jgi:hypothetical protein